MPGYSWSVLANTSYNQKEYGCSKKLEAEIKQEEIKLEGQLLGLSKAEIITRLGKPKPKDIKFGYPYSLDRNCFGATCQAIMSDEAWYYEFEKKIPTCGRYAYSMIIYFVNGKVVRVN